MSQLVKLIEIFDDAIQTVKYPEIVYKGLKLYRTSDRSKYPGCVSVNTIEEKWLGSISRTGRFWKNKECSEEVQEILNEIVETDTLFFAKEEEEKPNEQLAPKPNSEMVSVMFVHNLLDEYGLDPYEFRIYAHAVRRTGGKLDGKYFASLSKTAEICQMSVRRVQYSLKFLCEAGFLAQEKRTGRTDQYRLTPVSQWEKPEKLESIRETVTGVRRKKTKTGTRKKKTST